MTTLLDLDEGEVQETFFEKGWTDGLPVVPPTPARVEAMLAGADLEAAEVIGTIPARNRVVTAERAAINAVMAGCAPAYFPVVVAALSAVLDPGFNANTVLTSTGGASLATIVSGPLADELHVNSRHGALGPGHRANATIGRALRLVAMNVLGARPGALDGSSLGSPAKYTFCFAETPPPEPWQPLRVELGFAPEETTVTVVATEGPRQVANHLNPDGRGVAKTFASALRTASTFIAGKSGQAVLVIGPEHAQAMIEAGLSKDDVRRIVYTEARITPAELEAGGVLLETGAQHDMTPGPDGKVATIRSPEDIVVVTAGGPGAGWSAAMPSFAPALHTRATTRRVRPKGEAMPDCGPDSCEITF